MALKEIRILANFKEPFITRGITSDLTEVAHLFSINLPKINIENLKLISIIVSDEISKEYVMRPDNLNFVCSTTRYFNTQAYSLLLNWDDKRLYILDYLINIVQELCQFSNWDYEPFLNTYNYLVNNNIKTEFFISKAAYSLDKKTKALIVREYKSNNVVELYLCTYKKDTLHYKILIIKFNFLIVNIALLVNSIKWIGIHQIELINIENQKTYSVDILKNEIIQIWREFKPLLEFGWGNG